MAVDYEAAWDELQARLLQRDGWGTRTIIAEMADLRVKHSIPEGVLQRALRIAAAAASGLVSQREHQAALSGPPTASAQEAHDGDSNTQRAGTGAGAGAAADR